MSDYTPYALIKNKKEVPSEFNTIAKRYDLATFLSQGYQKDLQTSVDRMNLKGNQPALQRSPGLGVELAQEASPPGVPQGRVGAVDVCNGQHKQVVEVLLVLHMFGELLDNLRVRNVLAL